MKEISMISLSNYPDVRIIREASSIIKSLDLKINIFCNKEENKPDYERNYSEMIIRFFDQKKNKSDNKFSNYFITYFSGLIKMFFLIVKHKKVFFKSSIIHLHNPPDFLTIPLLILKFFFNKKLILDRHEPFALSITSILGKGQESLLYKILSAIEILNMKFLNGIVVINQIEKEYILRNLPNMSVVVVGNSFDYSSQSLKKNGEQSNFKKTNLGFNDDDKIILYEGLIAKRRDLDVFIEIFKNKSISDNYKGIILGNGDYKINLKKKIKNLSFGAKIKIIDAVEPDEVFNYIGLADICLVLASNIPLYRLYTPNKLFEYLYLKKKVIVPKLENIRNLTFDKLTYYKSGSAASLKSAIHKMEMIDKEIYLKNIEYIINKNDWNNYSKNLIKLYRGMINK